MFDFIKRLFPDRHGGFKTGSSSVTNPLDADPTIVKSLSRSRFQVASCQSSGRERSHNEDTLFTFTSLLDGMDPPITFGIYLVADGMGGHQNGEVASSLAAQGVSQYLIDHIYQHYFFDHQSFSDEVIHHYLQKAVEEAQALIKHRVPGGGTTLTAVMGLGDQFFSAHIGDSRLYIISKNGRLSLKTKDHSLVKRLVDLGEITEQEASRHPERNVLYRALGQLDPLHADINQFSLSKGDRLLICSDGLWGVLPDEHIEEMTRKSHNLDELALDLVQAANDLGGPDNISVILVERIA